MDNSKTASLIRQLRKEKGMTQKDIADRLHITDQAVSKWERAISMPDISIIEELAEVLGITVSELITGELSQKISEEAEAVARNVISYSEREIVDKVNKYKRRSIISVLAIFLVLLLLIPTLNGIFFGNGFSWECIPAYFKTKDAIKSICTYDESEISENIICSENLYSSMLSLENMGVEIKSGDVSLSQIRLEDMYLMVECRLYVLYEDLTYEFTLHGTYKDGKVGFTHIFPASLIGSLPEWAEVFEDAVCTVSIG